MPDKQREWMQEVHFGEVKGLSCHGTPKMQDMIYGTQLLHRKQSMEDTWLPPMHKLTYHCALLPKTVAKLARGALNTACKIAAACSQEGHGFEKIRDDFAKWYEATGEHFLRGMDTLAPDESDSEDDDDMRLVEDCRANTHRSK
jgi:hypothetical protein